MENVRINAAYIHIGGSIGLMAAAPSFLRFSGCFEVPELIEYQRL
jgi:hypothetical protein